MKINTGEASRAVSVRNEDLVGCEKHSNFNLKGRTMGMSAKPLKSKFIGYSCQRHIKAHTHGHNLLRTIICQDNTFGLLVDGILLAMDALSVSFGLCFSYFIG